MKTGVDILLWDEKMNHRCEARTAADDVPGRNLQAHPPAPTDRQREQRRTLTEGRDAEGPTPAMMREDVKERDRSNA